MKPFIVSVLILSCFFTGCSSTVKEKDKTVIGVVEAKFDDTFRTSIRNELYKLAEDKVQIDIWSGDNLQKTENEKVDLLIKRKVKVLVVNLGETGSAAEIIDKAKKPIFH